MTRYLLTAMVSALAGVLAGLVLGRASAPRGLDASPEDLDYLLAHFWDEVDGHPDRSHWRLPLLRQAAGRLQVASWLAGGRPAAWREAVGGSGQSPAEPA